jgi:hypothetical protein
MTDNQPVQRPMRFAFYGRVCRDDDTASAEIDRQREECERVLPPGSVITAIFYDIGPCPSPRRTPWRRPSGRTGRCRDGGLDDLLREAQSPARRYDYFTACTIDRLSRDSRHIRELLRRLHDASIQPLIPGVPPSAQENLGLLDLLLDHEDVARRLLRRPANGQQTGSTGRQPAGGRHTGRAASEECGGSPSPAENPAQGRESQRFRHTARSGLGAIPDGRSAAMSPQPIRPARRGVRR